MKIIRKHMPLWIWPLQSFFIIVACAQTNSDDWKENLSFAEAQHEIIMTLISEEKYDQVLPELRKICKLKFPPKYENRLAKEIHMVSDQLLHKGQENLALQVLDEGLRSVNDKHCKAELYKEKGYIYKRQGNLAKVREMFRKAAELESK